MLRSVLPTGRGRSSRSGLPGLAKSGKNRLHFDLAPARDDDQATEVDRLIALGARRIDIGQGDVSWVVLADPDGNEFCLLRCPVHGAWLRRLLPGFQYVISSTGRRFAGLKSSPTCRRRGSARPG